MNEDKITVEQKAHDLAVAAAYASYSACLSEKEFDLESFYQEYERVYDMLLPIVKHYN